MLLILDDCLQVEQQFVLYLWELMFGSDSLSLAGTDRLVSIKHCRWSIFSIQDYGSTILKIETALHVGLHFKFWPVKPNLIQNIKTIKLY